MIYICKKKTFEKMAKKILPDYEYFIIDGEDTGSSVSTATKTISDTFSHCTADGNFTPPRKLTRVMLDEDVDDYDPDKVEDMIIDYFDNKRVKLSMIKAIKTMFALSSLPNKAIPEINVFIVLPNKVYKAMGNRFLNEYKTMFKGIPQFIFMDEVLKDDKKVLGKRINKDDLNKISKRISELEDKLSKKDKDKKDKKHKDKKDEDIKEIKKDKKKSKKKKHKDNDSFSLTGELDKFLW